MLSKNQTFMGKSWLFGHFYSNIDKMRNKRNMNYKELKNLTLTLAKFKVRALNFDLLLFF